MFLCLMPLSHAILRQKTLPTEALLTPKKSVTQSWSQPSSWAAICGQTLASQREVCPVPCQQWWSTMAGSASLQLATLARPVPPAAISETGTNQMGKALAQLVTFLYLEVEGVAMYQVALAATIFSRLAWPRSLTPRPPAAFLALEGWGRRQPPEARPSVPREDGCRLALRPCQRQRLQVCLVLPRSLGTLRRPGEPVKMKVSNLVLTVPGAHHLDRCTVVLHAAEGLVSSITTEFKETILIKLAHYCLIGEALANNL